MGMFDVYLLPQAAAAGIPETEGVDQRELGVVYFYRYKYDGKEQENIEYKAHLRRLLSQDFTQILFLLVYRASSCFVLFFFLKSHFFCEISCLWNP